MKALIKKGTQDSPVWGVLKRLPEGEFTFRFGLTFPNHEGLCPFMKDEIIESMVIDAPDELIQGYELVKVDITMRPKVELSEMEKELNESAERVLGIAAKERPGILQDGTYRLTDSGMGIDCDVKFVDGAGKFPDPNDEPEGTIGKLSPRNSFGVLDRKEAQKGTIERPPLGLMPRDRHIEERIYEIRATVHRFGEAKKPIPVEWIQEYNELVKSLSE